MEKKNPKISVELWSMKESMTSIYSLSWGYGASRHLKRCLYVLLISNITYKYKYEQALFSSNHCVATVYSLIHPNIRHVIGWLLEWMDEWCMSKCPPLPLPLTLPELKRKIQQVWRLSPSTKPETDGCKGQRQRWRETEGDKEMSLPFN